MPCTFDTLIFIRTLSLSISRKTNSRYRHSRPGAGFPPMTAAISLKAFKPAAGPLGRPRQCRWRLGPVQVGFAPAEGVRQHRGLVGILAPRLGLQGPAAGTDLWVGHDEDLH